jgi:hypothetical protein
MIQGMLASRRLTMLLGLAGLLALGLGACGDDDDNAAGTLTITDPYVRSAGNSVAAAYFTLATGSEGDRLIGASSPIAGVAQVHEVIVEGNAARMERAEGLELPANSTVTFEPGSYHVMLINLDHELEIGEMIELELEFEQAGTVTVLADVEDFGERIDSGSDPSPEAE